MFGIGQRRIITIIGLSAGLSVTMAAAEAVAQEATPLFLSRASNGKRKKELPPKKLRLKGHQYSPRPYGRRT